MDVGTVRVGVAATDPDRVLASPVTTLARDTEPGADGGADVAAVASLVAQRRAVGVLVGLPLHLRGAEGASARDAREWAGRLAQAVAPVPVELVDERLTTAGASRALSAAGVSAREQRGRVDAAAAVEILAPVLSPYRVADVTAVPPPGSDRRRGRPARRAGRRSR